MKILQKTDAEKTNRESDAPSRNMRYTESVHRENTKKNEVSLSTVAARCRELFIAIMQKRILPPSKSDIGSRLSKPKNIDAAKNISVNAESSDTNRRIIIALVRFARGPASAISISFL